MRLAPERPENFVRNEEGSDNGDDSDREEYKQPVDPTVRAP